VAAVSGTAGGGVVWAVSGVAASRTPNIDHRVATIARTP
jgi:hypothetical protein